MAGWLGAASGLVGGITGWLGQKQRGDAPSVADFDWTNSAALKNKLSESLLGKINNPTQYKYNDAFTLDQPQVEKAAESAILGKLNNGVSNVSDYGQATKQYSDAMKANRELTYADEKKKTQDMYNRLGLSSSTPGLAALGDLDRKQSTEATLFDSELMYNNLDRTLEAQGLDINEMNSILGQAQAMGQTQRGSQQYSQQMSMDDLSRMSQEEQAAWDAALAYLNYGASTPGEQYDSRLFQWSQPTSWDQIGNIVTSTIDGFTGSNMLGGGKSSGGTTVNNGVSSKTTIRRPTYMNGGKGNN